MAALLTGRARTQADWHSVLERATTQADRLRGDAQRAMDDVTTGSLRALAGAKERSQALVREIAGQGPQKTLGRGFVIVRRPCGLVVTGAAGVAPDHDIEIKFRDGTVAARTLKKDKE